MMAFEYYSPGSPHQSLTLVITLNTVRGQATQPEVLLSPGVPIPTRKLPQPSDLIVRGPHIFRAVGALYGIPARPPQRVKANLPPQIAPSSALILSSPPSLTSINPYCCPSIAIMPADRGNNTNKATHRVRVSPLPTDGHPCTFPGCTVVISRANDVKRHLRTHSDAREFECEYEGCNYSVKQKSNLTAHVNKVHLNDNRPFGCPVPGCENTFGDPSARSRHKKKCTERYCQANGTSLEDFLASLAPSTASSSDEDRPRNRKRKHQDPNVPACVGDLINQESQNPAGDLSQFRRFPVESQSPESQGFDPSFDGPVPELSPSSSTSSLHSLVSPKMPSLVPQVGLEFNPVNWSWINHHRDNKFDSVLNQARAKANAESWEAFFAATMGPKTIPPPPTPVHTPETTPDEKVSPAVGSTGYLAGLLANGLDPALLEELPTLSNEITIKAELPSPVLAQMPLEFDDPSWETNLANLAQYNAIALQSQTSGLVPHAPVDTTMNTVDDWTKELFAPALGFDTDYLSLGMGVDAYNTHCAIEPEFDFTSFEPQHAMTMDYDAECFGQLVW
ncbi:unnamed protein product [Cyclocybe aegerita]|uniref:C2H2-type domain-containing protein n=1 Tax=Cyclocybe aegerita TaxID=1973307 RepID=A0A8S0VUP7_CYCAE|nr:unnamed protein product [Cyclocybe aegerita]